MGDAADDLYEAEQASWERRMDLRKACPRKDPRERRCSWFINDDSLYQCNACGKVTDL